MRLSRWVRGHPTDLVLSRLSDANVKTYRTDLNGDIWVYSDGENITVETDKLMSKQDIYQPNDVVDTGEQYTTEGELQEYVLNTKTMKFHYPSCGGLPTKNRTDTIVTRDELIAQGV